MNVATLKAAIADLPDNAQVYIRIRGGDYIVSGSEFDTSVEVVPGTSGREFAQSFNLLVED